MVSSPAWRLFYGGTFLYGIHAQRGVGCSDEATRGRLNARFDRFEDGPTHQPIEQIASLRKARLRPMPRMQWNRCMG